MACPCEQTQYNNEILSSLSSGPVSTENCEFTLEILENYREKLRCAKETDYQTTLGITEAQINSYLGIVISSVNYRINYCRFERELLKIRDLIVKMISLNLC